MLVVAGALLAGCSSDSGEEGGPPTESDVAAAASSPVDIPPSSVDPSASPTTLDPTQPASPDTIVVDPADTEQVLMWQQLLSDLGFEIVVDGLWGPGTEATTMDFQTFFGLPPTGTVSKATYDQAIALRDAQPPPAPPS